MKLIACSSRNCIAQVTPRWENDKYLCVVDLNYVDGPYIIYNNRTNKIVYSCLSKCQKYYRYKQNGGSLKYDLDKGEF